MRQILTNSRGTEIATIEDRGECRQILLSQRGTLLGEYNKCNNTTTTGSGRYVGQGNQLGSLIREDGK